MEQEPEPELFPSLSLPTLTGPLGEVTQDLSARVGIISDVLRKIANPLSQLLNEIIQAQERTMAPIRNAIEGIRASHLAAAKVHDQVLDALLARGWCHSYHFTDAIIIHLGELVAVGKSEEIDEVMAEFTRHESDGILATACEKYTDRAPILIDAFEAHRDKKYTLSIPVLLNQLDGIGCEVMGLGRHFFFEKRRADALAKIVSEFKWPWDGSPYTLGGINERMLAALERAWSLTQDTNLRTPGSDYSPLNRHAVLHGLDTDYPSEFNSLRCILNLGFVLEVRKVLREDIPRQLQELEEMYEKRSG